MTENDIRAMGGLDNFCGAASTKAQFA